MRLPPKNPLQISAIKKMQMTTRIIICSLVFVSIASRLSAQQKNPDADTSRKQGVVEIISSYKPVLRNAVKINFSASHPEPDTNHAQLRYLVPVQNLYYPYKPMPINPIALQHDTLPDLGIWNYIKAGFGNYTTPYAKAGLSFGDCKKEVVNFYGDYISSKGNIQNQDYSQLNLKANGSYFSGNNETYGGIGFSQNKYYEYGYNDSLHDYSKDSVKQNFNTIGLTLGIRNVKENETGINHNPNLYFDIFGLQNKASETSVKVETPFEKKISDSYTIQLSGKADVTTYSTKDLVSNLKLHNNVFSISPALQINGDRAIIHVGVTPLWDNGKLNLLPNLYADIPLLTKTFTVQAGWVGQVDKNTLQHLSSLNPYLETPVEQPNTKQVELYGGIKTSIEDHFNINAKVGFITFHNVPLFVNDTLDGKSFYISNEGKMNDVRIHADVSYINAEKFTVTGGFNFNAYTGLENNAKPWGLSPLDVDASLHWWALKNVLLKADLKAFSGASYLLKNNVSGTTSGGTDISVGTEYVITKKWSAWLNLNNILNNKYQRWYNYPVYGFNVLIGAIYKF